MIIVMTILSLVVIGAFVAVLVVGLVKINEVLEAIGGERYSYKGNLHDVELIQFGVRAIEQQTSHLEPALAQLNQGLVRASEGLHQIDSNLQRTLDAVQRQREG
jgi:hypothetical protein